MHKKILEKKEEIHLTNEELRTMLKKCLEREKASYICKVTGINKDVLSAFKNGKIENLYPHLFEKLEAYLLNK